nr:SPOR domain-containing protein [Polymorphobacter sp.]
MAKGSNRRSDDDDAPWLAEASPRAETRVSRRSFFWTLLVLLTLAAVAAIGLIILISKKDAGSTQGYMNAEQAPLITAEPGPYKVAPLDPKGLQVEGQDQTLYAAGEGIDQGSTIDQSAMPEQPLPRPGTGPSLLPGTGPSALPGTGPSVLPGTVAPAPRPGLPADLVPQVSNWPTREEPDVPAPKIPAPKPAPAKPVITAPVAAAPIVIPPPAAPKAAAPKPAVPKPAAPAKKPGTVQLGAFSSEAAANTAWATLAGKHGLSGKRVIAVDSGGKTLYRLRATTPDTAATCAKLKAAGDACSAVE